eukprot:scaffold62970_cov16-Tisochrysis_lutea.AAC.1
MPGLATQDKQSSSACMFAHDQAHTHTHTHTKRTCNALSCLSSLSPDAGLRRRDGSLQKRGSECPYLQIDPQGDEVQASRRWARALVFVHGELLTREMVPEQMTAR